MKSYHDDKSATIAIVFAMIYNIIIIGQQISFFAFNLLYFIAIHRIAISDFFLEVVAKQPSHL